MYREPGINLKPSVLAMFVLFPVASWAQGASVPKDEGLTRLTEVTISDSAVVDTVGLGKKVVTGSRLGLTVKETPAAVTVIDREMLEERGIETTQEALKSVPGVTTSSAPGSPGAVFYRGFSGGSVTQLFNGITVQYDAIAARPVDSWIYDRVEAIGGPSTFLYGAGAVGGSINYVTKLAHRDGDHTDLKASYGRFDANQLSAGGNRKVGDSHYLRLDVNRNASNGWSNGTERESWQVAGSWLWDLTPYLSHTLAVEQQKEQVDRPYWGTPIRKPVAGQISFDRDTRYENYNSRDGLFEQDVRWGRSILEFKATDNLRLKNTVYHYDALRDYRNVETYAFNASNTSVTRSNAYYQRHDQSVNGNRLEFNWNSKLGSLPSAWAGGVDYSLNKQTRYPSTVANVGPLTTVNPYHFTTENFFSIPGTNPVRTPDRSNRVTTLAFFLENKTNLTRDLSLLTGLRRDDIELEVTNHRTVTATDPSFFRRNYTPTTGRAALAYDLTPNANVYIQYSTAADPPAGLMATANFSQVRDFDLTTGTQKEVGSKFSFAGGKGSGTVALYEIVRKNVAVTDPNNPGTTVPVGQQSSRGIELSAAYTISSHWRTAGNLSLVDAQYDEFYEKVGALSVSREGNRPTNIPKRVANFWLIYSPTAAWEVGADARYVSSRYADAANTVSDGAYSLFGAFASYKFDRTTKVVARIKNLTDKIYAENLSGTSMAYLGAPRTFDVSVQTSF
jgi:iron complex outermembrane receptor protein